MRFIDEAKIRISAGHGGPGCISFRRETFIPRGGPDGGDGGAGGDVVFIASSQLGTLQDFRFRRLYHAEDGLHGSGANKAGKDGKDTVIRVPVGTVIKDTNTGEVLIDFETDQQEWLACKGGRGGKGNAHFVSSTHQAPKFAQPGEEGTSLEITLELKLLADVGIIGFPNAGKSTLISRISAAKPKIANYAFTTLTPHLGVVSVGDNAFVVADMPGLVEGAHKGFGLGHRFLKHIERTHVFIHLLDATLLLGPEILDEKAEAHKEYKKAKKAAKKLKKAIEEGLEDPALLEASVEEEQPEEDPIDRIMARYQAIRNELGLFNEKLLHKPEVIVLNKLDALNLTPAEIEDVQKAVRQRIASIRGTAPINGEPFLISAVSGQGLDDLVFEIYEQIKLYRAEAQKKGPRAKPADTLTLPDDERIRK